MKMTKKGNDRMATIAGLIVAIMTAWMLIDWDNFEFTPKNIFVLVIATMNAVAGYITTLKTKDDN